MPDQQTYPPYQSSRVPHVGTYRRRMAVSMTRMFENTLDWEHLPYLHRSSFTAIECEAAGPWGWRARVTNARGQDSVIELLLDRSLRRWISRTLSGVNAGSEIWTHAFELASRSIEVVVDFFAPDVAAGDREKVGRAFARLYERLYDEDVAMMSGRQQQLDQKIEAPAAEAVVELGPRERLSLPLEVELGGRRVVVVEDKDELIAFGAVCPHQMGPLGAARVCDGIVECPWHGYRFDVRTGDCLSGQTSRLMIRPLVEERDGAVRLRYREPHDRSRV